MASTNYFLTVLSFPSYGMCTINDSYPSWKKWQKRKSADKKWSIEYLVCDMHWKHYLRHVCQWQFQWKRLFVLAVTRHVSLVAHRIVLNGKGSTIINGIKQNQRCVPSMIKIIRNLICDDMATELTKYLKVQSGNWRIK